MLEMPAPTTTALDALLRQAIDALTRQRNRRASVPIDERVCTRAAVQLADWQDDLRKLEEEGDPRLSEALRAAAALSPQVAALCSEPPRPTADDALLWCVVLSLSGTAATVLQVLDQPPARQLNNTDRFRLATWATTLLPLATQQLPVLAATAAVVADGRETNIMAAAVDSVCQLGCQVLSLMHTASLKATQAAGPAAAVGAGACSAGIRQHAEQQSWRAATLAVLQRRALLLPFLAACAGAACTLAEAHADLAAVAEDVCWCHTCLHMLLHVGGPGDLANHAALLENQPQLAHRLARLLLAYLQHTLAEAAGGGPDAAVARARCLCTSNWDVAATALAAPLQQYTASPSGMAALRGVLHTLRTLPLQPPPGDTAAAHALLLGTAVRTTLRVAACATWEIAAEEGEWLAHEQLKRRQQALCLLTEALDAGLRPLSAVLGVCIAHSPLSSHQQQRRQRRQQQQQQQAQPSPTAAAAAAAALPDEEDVAELLDVAKTAWWPCCHAAGLWATLLLGEELGQVQEQAQAQLGEQVQQVSPPEGESQQRGVGQHAPERWLRLMAKLLQGGQLAEGAAHQAEWEERGLAGCSRLAALFLHKPVELSREFFTQGVLPMSATALKALHLVARQHAAAAAAATAAAGQQSARERAVQWAEAYSRAAPDLLVAAATPFIWHDQREAELPLTSEQECRVMRCLCLQALAAVQALPPAVAAANEHNIVVTVQESVARMLHLLEPLPPSSSDGASSSSGTASPTPVARAVEEAHTLALRQCAWLGCTNLAGDSETELRSQLCKGCLLVRYCSAACQREDWKQHRVACKALAAQRQG